MGKEEADAGKEKQYGLFGQGGYHRAVVTAKQSRCKTGMLNGDKKTSGIIKKPEQYFQPFRQ